MPDKVKCHDFQILKLQEAPDSVPHGEMPRHMQLFLDRFLCDRVVPGNRVTVLGIYSIKKTGQVNFSMNFRSHFSKENYLNCIFIRLFQFNNIEINFV